MVHYSILKRTIFVIAALAFFFISSNTHAQSSSAYKRGAIMEEFTGTWCPHCPPGAWALDTMQVTYGDNLVEIAWHGGPSIPGNTNNEPLWLRTHDTLFGFFGLTGWPQGILNRSTPPNEQGFGITPPPSDIPVWIGEANYPNTIEKVLTQTPLVDYRIVNATYDPSGRTVSFDVDVTPYDMTKMRSDATSQYATVAVLTEDNVLETQANYGDWDQVPAGDLENFHEMNVVRKVAGGALIGDNFTLGTSNPTQSLPIRIHYSMNVNSAWSDANIRVKTFTQETYPKGSKQITVDVMDAKQTGYVSGLPLTAPSLAWVVLPNSNSTVKPAVPTNIVWATGGNAGPNVKLEYSIDNGLTWNLISASTNKSPYPWNMPQSAYGGSAMVRVSDAANAGTNGVSQSFKTPGIINVTKPVAGEVIMGGSSNYLITFTGGNLKADLKFEYSLDNGTTWTTLGLLGTADGTSYNWTTVVNPPADAPQSLIRISDANGVIGLSKPFTIKAVAGAKGTITNVILNGLDANHHIDNNRNLGVQWTAPTGNIGTGIDVYFSSDNGTTWQKQTTAPLTSDKTSYTFKTPATGFYPNCTVKVQSSSDGTIGATWSDGSVTNFIVGASSGVYENGNIKGYSITNYPNPFGSSTTIKFELPVRSFVTIKIQDELGREIDKLVTETLDAGMHNITYNAANISNGVYTYTLEAGATKLVGKMSVVK